MATADYEVQYGTPAKVYLVKARSMLAAGWVFARNLPPGARPGGAVSWVSRAGHNAWFPWEGAISADHRVLRVRVTYEALGNTHTETISMRADSQAEATQLLKSSVKSLRTIEFLDARGRRMTEEQEEELEAFFERWNGD